MTKITKKILLNSTNFFNQEDEDIYLDVEIYSHTNEIRPEKYDNDFDLQKEFEKERNLSRNFILYGTVDSVVDFNFKKKYIQQTIYNNNTKKENAQNQISIINQTIITNNRILNDLNNSARQLEFIVFSTQLQIIILLGNPFATNTINVLTQNVINYSILLVATNNQINSYTAQNNGHNNNINNLRLIINNLDSENNRLINFLSEEPESFLELWKLKSKPTIILESPEIESYISQNTIILNDNSILEYIQKISTNELNYKTGNVFEVLKRRYYLELDNYTSSDQETLYIFVNGDLLNDSNFNFFVKNQLFKQEIVFRDPDGQIIPYGTDEEFINNDGTTYSVNNNFPFFYNKHWVKQNIIIEKSYLSKVAFEIEQLTIKEGELLNISVVLDKPTLEDCSVTLEYLNLTASENDYEILQDTITFNAGTKSALLSIKASSDSDVEVSEKFKIIISHFFNCEKGANSELEVTIMKSEINNFVLYDLQSMYKNLLSFEENNPANTVLYSNLRDGYFIGDKDSKSFFPNNNYIINIKNNGIDTILPSNNSFNNNDIIFKSGETLSYEFENLYSGSSKQTVGLKINVNPFSLYNAIVNINGIIYTEIKTNQDLIDKLNLDQTIKTYTYSTKKLLNADGDVIEEYILLESTRAGLPIIVKNLEENVSYLEFVILDYTDPRFVNFVPYSSVLAPIKLLSNTSDGNFCNYEFSITKQGYKNIDITSEQIEATSIGTNCYLVTGYRDINSAYKDNDCFNSVDLNTEVNLITSYVNGILFNYNSNNLTDVIYSKFLLSPKTIIPCTSQNGINGFNISI